MAASPRISLEHWRALQAVVEAGGYAQAAARLHKSQSAITYAVQKIEALLQVKVFEISGPQGAAHRQRRSAVPARPQPARGGRVARGCGAAPRRGLGERTEARGRDRVSRPGCCCAASSCLPQERPETRIELYETVLSGTDEALVQRRVDLAICSQVPPGFIGDALMRLRFIAAAHPDHPLHRLGRELTRRICASTASS